MVKGFLNVGQSSLRPILVWVLELWKLPSETELHDGVKCIWAMQVWKPTHFIRSFCCSLRSSVNTWWYRV